MKKRSVPVLTATLILLLKHPTQQDVGLCYRENWLLLLAQREGHSNITDPNLECSQRTTANGYRMSPFQIYPTLLASWSSPSVFSLLATIATASNVNISTLASCGWLTSLLHLCKSHNTPLQFDPCYKTLLKCNLLCPARCLCSAVLHSSSRVNVLQPKTLHCLL